MGPLTPVLDGLEVGVAIVEKNGRISVANHAIADLFGLDRARLLNLPARIFVEHVASLIDSPTPLVAARDLVSWDGVVRSEQLRLARPTTAVVRWVARGIELASGPVLLVSCTDITAEIALAHQIR